MVLTADCKAHNKFIIALVFKHILYAPYIIYGLSAGLKTSQSSSRIIDCIIVCNSIFIRLIGCSIDIYGCRIAGVTVGQVIRIIRRSLFSWSWVNMTIDFRGALASKIYDTTIDNILPIIIYDMTEPRFAIFSNIVINCKVMLVTTL